MPVRIVRLVQGLHRTLWRHGFVHPERLTHHVDECGDHRFSLTIHASEAEYAPPQRGHAGSLGASTAQFMKDPKA